MSDQVAVIGSFLLIGACVAVIAFATTMYRKSKGLSEAAIISEPGTPLELVCGIRLGLLNATWPAGRCRLGEQSVRLSCLGFAAEATWADVKAVELIKPLNQIGWGVRFRIPAMRADSAIVWLGSRQLAEWVIESCTVHKVLTEMNARVVL